MHKKQDLSTTDLTMYDDRLTEDERKALTNSRILLLVFWVLNVFAVIYLSYRLFYQYESFFVGYVVFSVIALVASLLYACKYNAWYGNNILIGFILVLFVLVSIVFFVFIIIVEFVPIKEIQHLKRGHGHWAYSALTVALFFIPLVHSLLILCLWWQRRSAENRIKSGGKPKTEAKGRITLNYKPQVDDNEKSIFQGVRNLQ